MLARDLFGLLTAFLVLSGISVAVLRGDKAAALFKGFADGFSEMEKSATATG